MVNNVKECPTCGIRYENFRTGMTFADVKAEMFVESENSEDWVYKRRKCVLRRWNKIKIAMWKYHLEECKTGNSGIDLNKIDLELEEY